MCYPLHPQHVVSSTLPLNLEAPLNIQISQLATVGKKVLVICLTQQGTAVFQDWSKHIVLEKN